MNESSWEALTRAASAHADELLANPRLTERQRLVLAFREGAIEQIKLDTLALRAAQEPPNASHPPV